MNGPVVLAECAANTPSLSLSRKGTAFVTLWTVACHAPLSTGFSDKNTRVGCHALLQGIFLTQGLNHSLLSLLIGRWVLYH